MVHEPARPHPERDTSADTDSDPDPDAGSDSANGRLCHENDAEYRRHADIIVAEPYTTIV